MPVSIPQINSILVTFVIPSRDENCILSRSRGEEQITLTGSEAQTLCSEIFDEGTR
jgi:hypothetical protein